MARRLPRKLKEDPHLRWDANFPDDPAVVAAGEQAAWLYLVMACECRRRRNDGVLAPHLVARLGVRGWQQRLSRLIEVGLVIEGPEGYLLPGYPKWNKCEIDYDRDQHNGRIGGCLKNHPQPCERIDCQESRTWLEANPS